MCTLSLRVSPKRSPQCWLNVQQLSKVRAAVAGNKHCKDYLIATLAGSPIKWSTNSTMMIPKRSLWHDWGGLFETIDELFPRSAPGHPLDFLLLALPSPCHCHDSLLSIQSYEGWTWSTEAQAHDPHFHFYSGLMEGKILSSRLTKTPTSTML